MTSGYIPADIANMLVQIAAQVEATVDGAVVSQIISSFDALGYDVDTSYERIVSTLNVLVTAGEWDSDHGLALVEALADGFVSEAEIDSILMGVGVTSEVVHIPDDIVEEIKDRVDTVLREVEEVVENYEDRVHKAVDSVVWYLELEVRDLKAQIIELENRPGYGLLSPLIGILEFVVDNISERLDEWIATAIGTEE